MRQTVHIVGAGLAGLAAAVSLSGSGWRVVVYDSAPQAGGRCRSYFDTTLGMTIDNGNHLLLSGNHAALSFLRRIGSEHSLQAEPCADFAFVDGATGQRWTLRLNRGRIPSWIFDPRRRVPGSVASDYLWLLPLFVARAGRVGDVIRTSGPVYDRFVRPLLLAALNIDPATASARLASAVVRGTIGGGGHACRPLIARAGLSAALVDPALRFIETHDGEISMGRRLRAFDFGDARVTRLNFSDGITEIAREDAVILAVPPTVAAELVPGLTVPTQFCAIVNVHFRVDPPSGMTAMVGVLNATTEWIFAFPGRLAVTVSDADRLLDLPRETIAEMTWKEVSAVARLDAVMPRWQVVRERRATFAATAEQDMLRPSAPTAYTNLVLAGDWTATGLPATIEGAIRSGQRAAELVSHPSSPTALWQ
ncbi:MAG: FAD-dependent oxidoreductase [Proteobacteria bacterium]|nr:FAD-dependent oxidoreductase [Pseudomonadota bacterium]